MKKEDWIALLVYGSISVMMLLCFISYFNWESPWVNVLGSLLGGLITLAVMYFTNKSSRENVERTIEANKQLRKQEEALQIKPYIIIQIVDATNDYNFVKRYKADALSTPSLGGEIFMFKNVGLGTAIDLKIVGFESNGNGYRQLLPNNHIIDSFTLQIDNSILGLIEWDCGSDTNGKYYGDNFVLKIQYSDLLGRRYEQDFTFETLMNSKINLSSPESAYFRQYAIKNEIPVEI